MKYALIIPDGCADEPQNLLGGRTPLQAAHVPMMDGVVQAGLVGRADNTPPSLPSGSDVATMSLFGYNPLQFHTGRAPIEAAAQGIPLAAEDWAIRCNIVTILDGIMKSFTAEQISNDLARSLLKTMQGAVTDPRWEFHPGVSYRNLLIYRGKDKPAPFDLKQTKTTPPHDLTDGPVAGSLPAGPGSQELQEFMDLSRKLFATQADNLARQSRGKHPATQVWLWGLGQAPALGSFKARFGVQGAMITAVDLLRGLARLLDWKVIEVPGATGYLDTDYAAKGRYAVEALDHHDFVVVHVEATDEASHEGEAHEKVKSLEEIDRHIVGPVWEKLRSLGDYRLLISPDHPTFLRTKTHSYGFVPFALCGTGVTKSGAGTYDEVAAAESKEAFPHGWDLMDKFLHATW
ncbi:MAG: cofactor-independent phosphoglycerate mutase [Planctomycetales bacterium]